jgi:hypothetical protein
MVGDHREQGAAGREEPRRRHAHAEPLCQASRPPIPSGPPVQVQGHLHPGPAHGQAPRLDTEQIACRPVVEHSTGLFDAATAHRLAEAFARMVTRAGGEPDLRPSELGAADRS